MEHYTMATVSMEERVKALEDEMAELKQELASNQSSKPIPWWEKIYGTFADSDQYEEAMRLGRECRKSPT
jgi:hypothetical protein